MKNTTVAPEHFKNRDGLILKNGIYIRLKVGMLELVVRIMEMKVENVLGNKSLSVRKKDVRAAKEQTILSPNKV